MSNFNLLFRFWKQNVFFFLFSFVIFIELISKVFLLELTRIDLNYDYLAGWVERYLTKIRVWQNLKLFYTRYRIIIIMTTIVKFLNKHILLLKNEVFEIEPCDRWREHRKRNEITTKNLINKQSPFVTKITSHIGIQVRVGRYMIISDAIFIRVLHLHFQNTFHASKDGNPSHNICQ